MRVWIDTEINSSLGDSKVCLQPNETATLIVGSKITCEIRTRLSL